MVAVTVPVLMVTAGMRSAPGAWLVPMRDGLGWSTASLSLAAAIGLLVYGFAGPVAGAAIARFGVRAVVVTAMAASAATMAWTSRLTTPAEAYWVFGFASGVSTGLVGGVLGAVVANRWFVRHRGVVVGAMGAATSAGQLVFYPLLTAWAVDFGWRTAATLLAAACVAMIVPVVVWMRNDPRQVGTTALGGAPEPVPPPTEPAGQVMRRALTHPTFWLLCITFYVCGASSNGIVGQHFIPHAVDHGFDELAAAGALAIVGAFNFVGTLASGWATDRFDPRKLLLVYYLLRGVSLLALPFVHDQITLTAFAVLFGLDYIATVPPTVALAADTFGRRNVGVVYGWIFAAHQVGAAMAAWGAGWMRDLNGDYVAAFLAAGALAISAGLAALTIRRAKPHHTAHPTA